MDIILIYFGLVSHHTLKIIQWGIFSIVIVILGSREVVSMIHVPNLAKRKWQEIYFVYILCFRTLLKKNKKYLEKSMRSDFKTRAVMRNKLFNLIKYCMSIFNFKGGFTAGKMLACCNKTLLSFVCSHH